MESVNKKIFWYFFGFICIFYLLGSMFPNVDYNKDTNKQNDRYTENIQRVTKLVESLENNTTDDKLNLTLEDILKLVSDDSELSTVKKEIEKLKDKYEYDYEYAYDDTISDLSDRVDAVELKLNNQIEDTKQNIKDREEREALEKSQEKEKNYQEETKKVDLEAYYNAIQNAINQVNTEVGYNSLEMEKTYETPGIRITLSEDNASYSNNELRAIINALNKSLYNIAKSYGINSPRFYYTLSGEEVAVNRYIMAPDEVKFSGVLKQ